MYPSDSYVAQIFGFLPQGGVARSAQSLSPTDRWPEMSIPSVASSSTQPPATAVAGEPPEPDWPTITRALDKLAVTLDGGPSYARELQSQTARPPEDVPYYLARPQHDSSGLPPGAMDPEPSRIAFAWGAGTPQTWTPGTSTRDPRFGNAPARGAEDLSGIRSHAFEMPRVAPTDAHGWDEQNRQAAARLAGTSPVDLDSTLAALESRGRRTVSDQIAALGLPGSVAVPGRETFGVSPWGTGSDLLGEAVLDARIQHRREMEADQRERGPISASAALALGVDPGVSRDLNMTPPAAREFLRREHEADIDSLRQARGESLRGQREIALQREKAALEDRRLQQRQDEMQRRNAEIVAGYEDEIRSFRRSPEYEDMPADERRSKMQAIRSRWQREQQRAQEEFAAIHGRPTVSYRGDQQPSYMDELD